MAARSMRRKRRASTIEEVLSEELKHRVSSPLNLAGVKGLKACYKGRVVEMALLKEVLHLLSKRDFEELEVSEVYSRVGGRTWRACYNLVFKSVGWRVGYAALIYIPVLRRGRQEGGGGVVLAARYSTRRGDGGFMFEGAGFEDYVAEVKPHVELIRDLSVRARRL